MSAKKWLALPKGTEVRMTCDYEWLTKWDIVVRKLRRYDTERYVAFTDWEDLYYLHDDQWELIEEPSKEWLIQDANGNLTKSDSFRMPKQGDIIQVRDCSDEWWIDDTFVAFFDGKAITTPWWDEFNIWNEWRFPQEEVTLSDGKTYLVEERDGEKVLKLKN